MFELVQQMHQQPHDIEVMAHTEVIDHMQVMVHTEVTDHTEVDGKTL